MLIKDALKLKNKIARNWNATDLLHFLINRFSFIIKLILSTKSALHYFLIATLKTITILKWIH
jgi:hypothetical protein